MAKIVEFKMVDFFSRISEKFGENLIYKYHDFEPEYYSNGKEEVVETQCFDCKKSLYRITKNIKTEINELGIELELNDVLISFDWGSTDEEVDLRVKNQIQNVIEDTLNLKHILPEKDKNLVLAYIVFTEYDLHLFKINHIDKIKSKIYAIFDKIENIK